MYRSVYLVFQGRCIIWYAMGNERGVKMTRKCLGIYYRKGRLRCMNIDSVANDLINGQY